MIVSLRRHNNLQRRNWNHSWCFFLWFNVLRTSQLIKVMSVYIALLFSWTGLVLWETNQYLCTFCQLPFLNQWKRENDRRKYFMISLYERMLPDRGRSNPQPSDHHSDEHPTKPPRPTNHIWCATLESDPDMQTVMATYMYQPVHLHSALSVHWYSLQYLLMILRAKKLISKLHITKTRLFKYIENFTSKNWKFSDKKLWYFSHFCSKHRLWVLVRTASARRF